MIRSIHDDFEAMYRWSDKEFVPDKTGALEVQKSPEIVSEGCLV